MVRCPRYFIFPRGIGNSGHCKYFKTISYLQGRKFKIIRDCNSLTMTLNKRELNPRIARWSLELQDYDYFLEHRVGSRMQHADVLSRCLSVMVIESNTFEENLICQNKDVKLAELKNEHQKKQNKMYEMRNEIVYRKPGDGGLLFCLPDTFCINIMMRLDM